MQDEPIGMFVAVAVIALLTLVWLGVQLYFLVRLSKTEGTLGKGPLALWLVAVAGMFTGPCVAIVSLVTLGVAIAGAMRSNSNGRDRIAYRAVIVASSLGLVMVAIALVGAAASGAFAS